MDIKKVQIENVTVWHIFLRNLKTAIKWNENEAVHIIKASVQSVFYSVP